MTKFSYFSQPVRKALSDQHSPTIQKQRNKIKSIKHTLNIWAVSEDKLIWDVFNQSFGSTLFNCLLWRDLQYALFPIEANGYMVLVNFQLLWKV